MECRANKFISIYTILVVIVTLCIGLSHAGTHQIPPLYREELEPRVIVPDSSVIAPESLADDDYRLPNNTKPYHYEIDLTTDVHIGDLIFNGSVKIWIDVIESSSQIVIHKRQTNITAAILRSIDESAEYPLDFTFEETREFLTLKPMDSNVIMEKDSQWIIELHYVGYLRKDNAGFYLSTYSAEDNNIRYLATTQFESTDARHAFPCFDEPALRATFTITLRHSPSYNAISNMPVDEAASSEGVTVFEKTGIMPTYLIAFIVSDFEFTEGQLNGLTQRIFSRPSTKHQQELALVSGMLITERLADYYGVKFAYPKLDQVAVPDFAAGAMENWGLVTYREEYLLFDREKSPTSTETNIVNIIAHEYTHQWFGNYVAVRWWTYLWMKEGFATLFSYQASDDAYPEWGIYQLFHVSEYQSALNNDASLSSRPMTHYVQTPTQISRLYDTISYSKAGSVLHMWQNALTDVVFRDGLNTYLEENKFNSAVEEQLFSALDKGAKNQNYKLGDTVEKMMSTWTRQGGYPLLTVTRDYESGSFVIKQTPFFNDELISANKTWYIPINYFSQSNPDFRNTEATHYLKNEAQITVTAQLPKDDWLILNKQSTGYYRINYDDTNWQLIINGLIDRPYRIHPRNRAQLMHDAYRFSVSSRLSHSILLDLMSYLKNEDQYAPWATANSILTTFNLYLSGDEDYSSFQQYVQELVTPIYEKLGVDDVPGEQHFQKNVRTVALNLACLTGMQSCLDESNSKLAKYVDESIEIEPNLQTHMYCHGLRQTEDKYYNAIYDKLMTSEDQAERRILISSLGCSQNENQLKKFISSSIDLNNQLITQERTILLSPTYSRGSVGLLACIDFLNENWEAYGSLTVGTFGGQNPLNSDIQAMALYVVNEEQKLKMNELVAKVNGSSYVSNTLEETVNNRIDNNMAWLTKNRDPLMNYVNNLYKSSSSSITASFFTLILAFAVLVRQMR